MSSDPGPDLRKATFKDYEGIQRLITDNPDTILPRTKEELLELISSFWVLDDEGEIVGCACLEVYSPKIAEIRTVAVRSDKRGLGYGGILVNAAVEEAKQRHIKEVLVITSSPEWFRKLNFGSCLNEKYAMFWNGK